MRGAALGVQPHIGVVIAGNGGDACPAARDAAKPFGGKHKLLGQAEIDEIAGDRDVVRLPLDEIRVSTSSTSRRCTSFRP